MYVYIYTCVYIYIYIYIPRAEAQSSLTLDTYAIVPVSVTRFPSFRTQSLEHFSRYL